MQSGTLLWHHGQRWTWIPTTCISWTPGEIATMLCMMACTEQTLRRTTVWILRGLHRALHNTMGSKGQGKTLPSHPARPLKSAFMLFSPARLPSGVASRHGALKTDCARMSKACPSHPAQLFTRPSCCYLLPCHCIDSSHYGQVQWQMAAGIASMHDAQVELDCASVCEGCLTYWHVTKLREQMLNFAAC